MADRRPFTCEELDRWPVGFKNATFESQRFIDTINERDELLRETLPLLVYLAGESQVQGETERLNRLGVIITRILETAGGAI